VAPPAVSVVLPAHNPTSTLADAIASVISQSFDDWDLVVVDDGSTVDLSWVTELDPRVRVLRTEPRGVSRARNLGTTVTDGAFVAYLDQDDVWHPSKLSRQLSQIGDHHVLCYTAFALIDGAGTTIGPGYGRRVEYIDMLAGELGILLSSALVRRSALEVVGLFHPLLDMQQDLDLFLRLTQFGTSCYVESTEVEYRLHEDNASRDFWRASQELRLLLTLHELQARDSGNSEALEAISEGRKRIRRTYAYQAVDAARDAAHHGRMNEVPIALLRAARLSPSVTARSMREWLSARLPAA